MASKAEHTRATDNLPLGFLVKEAFVSHLVSHPPEITFAESKQWDTARSVRRHAHPDLYQLDYFWGGRGVYELSGDVFEIGSGRFVICGPGDSHSISVVSAEGLKSLGLKFRLAPVTHEGAERWLRFSRVFEVGPDLRGRLVSLLRKAVGHVVLGEAEDRIIGGHALEEFLVLLAGSAFSDGLLSVAPDRSTGRVAEEVLRYYEAHHAQRCTLTEVAQALGLSKFHLIRRFAEETGETPHRALTRIRLDHTRELLLRTRQSLSEIARQVGLKKPSHLSRLFKERFAVTPQAFRRGAARRSGGA